MLYNFCMEIYIESFVLQNVLINLCLLRLVYLTTKSKTTFFKLLSSSIIGVIPSVLVCLFLNNNILINITKLTTSLVMIVLAFKQSKKQFVFNYILLFIYTYAFGGIIISLSSTTYHTSFGMVTTSKFSLELICFILIVLTYIFELVVKHLSLKIKVSDLIYNLTLTQGNKSINVNAYLDTGNFLNLNGQPVLVLDLNAYLKLTNTNLVNFYTSKHDEISTQTINGNKNIKTFIVDKIEIKHQQRKILLTNQIVAINANNCFKNTNYQALISPLFL